MAVYFHTDKPNGLLRKFNDAIDEGKITTWERSEDDVYYTHKAREWAKKAWLKPRTDTGRLTFNIIKPKGSNVDVPVYAYYHGHLIETFLNHFDRDFSTGEAAAQPDNEDYCG